MQADIVTALPKTRSGKILRKAMRSIAHGHNQPPPLFQHHWAFRRVAMVSDTDWVAHTLHALAWMVPGELAIFHLDELERAKE